MEHQNGQPQNESQQSPQQSQLEGSAIASPPVPQSQLEESEVVSPTLPKSQVEESEQQPRSLDEHPLRIGIICQEVNREDLEFYRPYLLEAAEKYEGKISFVVFGYNGETEGGNILNGLPFEHIKPVSIVHYFKQLKALELDLIFVPLINNTYNATSENYNKYLEGAFLQIPLMAVDIFPYNKVIKDKLNGFIYPNETEFVSYLGELIANPAIIEICGRNAEQDMLENFNYTPDNIQVMTDLFV